MTKQTMNNNPTLSAAQGGSGAGEAAAGMSTDNLPKYTLVVVGDGAVGKSAITLQFLQHIFVEDYDPTIEDSYIKTIQIDGQWCVLDIFDTAGEDDFTAMRERYMRRGDGFLLVYSVTDPKSFSHVTKFYNQILRVKDQERYPVMLVGNKIDLSNMRSVSQADGIKLGQDLQIPYIETSAKTPAVNVDEAFHTIVRLIRMTQGGLSATPNGNESNANATTSSRLPVKEHSKGLCHKCTIL